MVDFNFWRRWLMAVSLIIIAFGAVIALLSWSPLFSVFNWLVNGTFWPGTLPDASTQSYQLWVYGMLGATMVGWGIFLAYITRFPFAKKEKWSWDCIALGVAAWFAIDTAVSAYVGAYFNVAINLLLLVLVALPLVATKKEFAV
jgi:uncharacterized BrkB/YihY/UPF0761 family membrane protein